MKRKSLISKKGLIKKTLSSALAVALVAAFTVPATAFAGSGDLTVSLVSPIATPVDLGDGTVANYLLLTVDPADDYTTGTYTIDTDTVEASPVLLELGNVTYIKVAVPAGKTSGILKVNDGAEVLSQSFTASTAGVAAPAVLFGKTAMNFSEYYYDSNAAFIDSSETAFTVGEAVASPSNFITDGTRNLWPANDSLAKVDAISSATYGDAVHFMPGGNYQLNYDPATTQGAGHAATGYKSIDVGIPTDLLTNATLLEAEGLDTAQSSAVLAQIDGVTMVDVSEIYKAKYLRTDAGWSSREATAQNEAAAEAWPGTIATSVSYGGNFTNREVVATFSNLPTNLTANSAALLWDNYLNNIYGGYIEDNTGHKEPLVWLQNIFTHKAHTNFEISINSTVFNRFSTLDISQPVKITVFSNELKDLEFSNITLKTYADAGASVEQGSTFYITQDSPETYFEDNQLHIVNVDPATFAGFNPSTARVTKSNIQVAGVSFAQGGSPNEIEISFPDSFFTSATVNGSYVISLVPEDSTTVHKTYNLTVNILVERPTLAVDLGDAFVATEANPAEVEQGQLLTYSDQTFAKAVTLPAGRAAGSTITDVTITGATTAPAIGNVLKLSDGTGSAYQIDTALLTVGHTYRLNTITTGFGTKANPSAAPSTTTQYFIKVIESKVPPTNDEVLRFDGKIDISKGTRYDTMKDIVVNGGAFTSANTNTLIVANGDNFPDALAASGFAGLLQAPVVMTQAGTDTLTPQAQEAIQFLKPSTIYILGSTDSIRASVDSALKAIPGVTSVQRLQGKTRYQTALAIYDEGKKIGAWSKTAIVANADGDNAFADALSISPYAFAEGTPIFLSSKDNSGLSAAALEAISSGNFDRILILGGINSVPKSVEDQLAKASSASQLRLAGNVNNTYGDNRYGTSTAIVHFAVGDSSKLDYNHIVCATGEKYADALAGGAFAGKIGTAMLLVNDASTSVDDVIKAKKDQIFHAHILGNSKAISDDLSAKIKLAYSS